MKLFNRFFRQLRVAACVALISFNAFTIDAKPRAAQPAKPAPRTSNETIINLGDFEPVGDGVADDGPALQRALDALGDAGGGTLIIPAGLYKIATPVVKDFSNLTDGTVHIQGVPSDTMPAPPTATGEQLARSLGLVSEFIPATGATVTAITLSNLDHLTVEHLAFTGTEASHSDAFITLFLRNIQDARIHHCEFYGISTFGWLDGLGGGNIIRSVDTGLSIEQTVFLGCAASSGLYAPIVENISWKKFHISNSIFIDYGLRSFFGKMGLGAPLSWINMGAVSPRTPEFPRREVVIRDTFLDEGGWIGITAFPHMWGDPADPIDLVYISGLKMNVSNLATAGNVFYEVRNILIENSIYTWSHNTSGAIQINRAAHAILDRLTCIEKADRLMADDRTQRLTVINSVYREIDSQAAITTELTTAPEDDPVQYVRQRFLSVAGRQPDPAAHFFWSDALIKCGNDNNCLNQERAALNEYLGSDPQTNFALAGRLVDENGQPVSGATVNLSGSQSTVTVTDALGNFRFSNLPTAGSYTVAVNKKHYVFTTASQTVARPAGDVEVLFSGRLNRHSISGRITNPNGIPFAGLTVKLVQSETTTTTTDSNGNYSFAQLLAGRTYTVVPMSTSLVFNPLSTVIYDLSADRTLNFGGNLPPELMKIQNSDLALVLESVSFLSQPFSIVRPFDFEGDGVARVVIFAKHLEAVAQPSQMSLMAEDAEGQLHPVEVEFMGYVAGQTWMKQLNIKIPPNVGEGGCVKLRLSVPGSPISIARVCFVAP